MYRALVIPPLHQFIESLVAIPASRLPVTLDADRRWMQTHKRKKEN